VVVGMIWEDCARLCCDPDKSHPLSIANEFHRRAFQGAKFRCLTYAS
jgi:hypothetical protein